MDNGESWRRECYRVNRLNTEQQKLIQSLQDSREKLLAMISEYQGRRTHYREALEKIAEIEGEPKSNAMACKALI